MGVPVVYLIFVAACIAGIWKPFYGLIGYVFFLFLMPEWNWRYSGIPLDAGFQKYLALSTLIGCALNGFKGNRFRGWFGLSIAALLLFLLFAWISSLQTISEALTSVYMDVISKSILMSVLSARLIDSPRKAQILLCSVLAGSGFNAFEINSDYFQTGYARWVNENWGLKGDNNIYSLFTFPAVCASILFLLNAKSLLARILFGLVAVLHLHQIMLLESRGSMLGVTLAVLIILILSPKTAHYWRIVIGGAIAIVLLAGPPVIKEFESIFASKENRDSSADSRFVLWSATLKVTADYPLLGVGPGATQNILPRYAAEFAHVKQKHPHNVLLEISSGSGLPAFLMILSFIAIPLFHSAQTLKPYSKPFSDGALLRVMLLAYIPGVIFSGLFSGSGMIESLYMVIATCAAGIFSEEEKDSLPEGPPEVSDTLTF